jgi:hypothetical protein
MPPRDSGFIFKPFEPLELLLFLSTNESPLIESSKKIKLDERHRRRIDPIERKHVEQT